MSGQQNKKIGLVLTSGGARAAYQAGVLRAVLEFWPEAHFPFHVIVGTSAGAINGSYLASRADHFREGARELWDIWWNLQSTSVFKSSPISLFTIASRLLKDLVFGGIIRHATSSFLLDTAPLRKLLRGAVDFSAIERNLKAGVLHGLAITATNLSSGTAISFYDGSSDIQDWIRTNRMSRRTKLGVDHVMASAAVPIFFPPVRLEGSFYSDGSVRLRAPLSPAIHLGAEKIFAVGIRASRPNQMVIELNRVKMKEVSLADITGVLLNATFLDSLDSDLERMERVNRTLRLLDDEKRQTHPDRLRAIETFVMRPSKDLGRLASHQFKSFPRPLRYMLRGLGAADERGWELESYFAFHNAYTSMLLDLGYEDAKARKDEIITFLAG